MPLILAIEPDKRQSGQLASLVKGLHAELVLRTNAADALGALHGRVPDLVLTTSLISPRDDAALGVHLRELGPAAAHVQTVTIPLLGSAAPQRAKGGMLAALRREKPQAPMTDGCEPAVFAEQVRQYLATAEEQKASAAIRASEPDPIAVEPEPVAVAELVALEAETMEAAPAYAEPTAESIAEASEEPIEQWIEPPAQEPAVVEIEMAAPAPEADDLVADEPAGLPLSQLLQMVSDAAPAIAAPIIAAPVVDAPVIEAPVAFVEPIVEPEPVIEVAAEPLIEAAEPVVEAAPALETDAVASFDDLYVDPMAAEALDELSHQAPPPALADGIPGEPPVPVVEMRSFQSLDAIASELAAGPAQQHESLDDLASLFAAAPEAAAGPAPVEPVVDFSAPMHGEKSLFASLFAEPAPARASKPVEIQGIDPSLFASPSPKPVVAFEEPVPVMAVEPEPPAPILAAPEPEPEPELEPLVSELVVAPAVEAAAVEAAAVEAAPVEAMPVEAADDELITLEPVVFEPVVEEPLEEPVAMAAEPAVDEEIALDVDAFAFTPPAPAAPAEPSRFSFTLVDGFGDTWSDFDVPSVATMAADLGIGEHLPLDPYASRPAPAAAASRDVLSEPQAAPALDEEALSLIGDAARKVSLDAMVIEEFERGLTTPRPKKAKKKPHAGATQVPAAAAPAAKPGKRPVQDEWGMFDPEQCGFAALDEEEDGGARPASGTRTRVISY